MNTKENCQEDITPPQQTREKELHFEMQDKEYLSSSNKNLEEHFENELNPWRAIMKKLSKHAR